MFAKLAEAEIKMRIEGENVAHISKVLGIEPSASRMLVHIEDERTTSPFHPTYVACIVLDRGWVH